MWPAGRYDSKSNISESDEHKLKSIVEEFANTLEQYCFHEKLNIFIFPIFKRFNLICYITSQSIIYLFGDNLADTRLIVFARLDENRADLTIEELEEKVNAKFGFELFKSNEWKNPVKIILPISVLGSGEIEKYQVFDHTAKSLIDHRKNRVNRLNNQISANPIFHGRNFSVDEDLCFILMPIKEPFNRIYQDHIIPVVKSCNFNPLRADDIFTSSSIVEDIWEHINRAKLIISDVSGKNPNVFYELGIAHTIGKDVIIITQNKDDIPFDLRHIRYFLYVDNEKGWYKLKDDLEKAIKSTLHKRK